MRIQAYVYKARLWLLMCSLGVGLLAGASGAGAAAAPLTKPDVIIDAGHGGIDGGASQGDWLEKDLNLTMSKSLYNALTAKKLTVVLDRTDDYALSEDNRWLRIRSRHKRDLAQRTGLANEIRPRLLVSLHLNTSRSAKQSGPLVLHQREPSSRLAAALIQQSLNGIYGVNRAPAVGPKYYVLNHAACPAVIVELGFLTNAADLARLTDGKQQQHIVQALAEAIEQYLLIEGALAQ